MPGCWPRCFGGGKKQPQESWKTQPMKGAVEKKKQPLSDFFKPAELKVLGELANRVRIVLDNTLPSTLHGTSCVEDGVPLAIINTKAPDKRYVILHELMHHQLDELGCPSLCCTLQAKEPPDSWLAKTQFPMFVRGLLVQLWVADTECAYGTCNWTGLLVQLWELIQHSRFNPMLKRVFGCDPQSAREGEYRGYMKRQGLPTYSMCKADGDIAVKRIAVAAHVATVLLEGNKALIADFTAWVVRTYPNGGEMVKMGRQIVGCITAIDVELLTLQRPSVDGIMQAMLADLQGVLDTLATGLRVRIGPIRPLKEKFNNRCTTVASVDFCDLN
ncbi:hypothetical protein T484DRAFT_1892147, partial [Baffinella frigidus]